MVFSPTVCKELDLAYSKISELEMDPPLADPSNRTTGLANSFISSS